MSESNPKKKKAPKEQPEELVPPPALPEPEPPSQEGDEDELLDLLELAQEGASVPTVLEVLRLSEKPSRISFFTRTCQRARLHYQEHESHRGYHHCLGEGCPPCLIGDKPTEVFLVPCFDFADLSIKVMRVPTIEGPHRLWSLIRPELGKPDLGNKVFVVTGVKGRYKLTVDPLPAHANRGGALIRQFEEDLQARRIKLRDAFRAPTAAELRAIPEIHNHLAAMGLLGAEEVVELDVLDDEGWEEDADDHAA